MSQKRKNSINKHYHSYNHKTQNRDLIDDMSECRIITKNLIYVIGLSASIANKEKLSKWEYFGQYGTIIKIVVNRNKAYNQNNPHGPSFSAFVTFSKPSEASIAILSLDETKIENHLIRASFGTTKYCSFFLKGVECTNKDCLFLHKIAEESDIIKRGDLNSNKTIFAKQHSYAIKIADIYNPEVKKKILNMKKGKTVFPSPDLIYRSIFVIENNPYNKKKSNSKKKIFDNNNNIIPNYIKSNNNNNNNNLVTNFYEKKTENIIKDYTKSTFSNNNKNNYKNNNENNNILKNIEKNNNIPENINIDINNLTNIKNITNSKNSINTESTNTSKEELYENNILKENTNNNLNENKNNNNNNKLFLSKQISRFNFQDKNLNYNDSVNVPIHIQQLINKKINLHRLTQYMHQNVIDKVLENEIINDNINTKKDDWIQFIDKNIKNKNKSDDEFVNLFEDINSFVLEKVLSETKEKKKK